MTNSARPAETLIPVAMLRQLTGAAPGEIEALVRSRHIIARSGKIALVSGVRAYLDSIRAATKSASLAAAQDASRSARTEAAELALAVDARRLVRRVEADDATAAICGAVAREIVAIPARSTRIIPDRRIIEASLFDAQNEIAQAVKSEKTLAAAPTPRKPRTRK